MTSVGSNPIKIKIYFLSFLVLSGPCFGLSHIFYNILNWFKPNREFFRDSNLKSSLWILRNKTFLKVSNTVYTWNWRRFSCIFSTLLSDLKEKPESNPLQLENAYQLEKWEKRRKWDCISRVRSSRDTQAQNFYTWHFSFPSCIFSQFDVFKVLFWGLLSHHQSWSTTTTKILYTVFENHRISRIQHCERSELRLHFEVKQCYQTGHFKWDQK